MGARRKARVCALQMLFQYDIARPRLDELSSTYWEAFGEEIGDVPSDFSNNLARGRNLSPRRNRRTIIEARRKLAHIKRMAVVDRNILRLAIYEFLYEPDTPKTVIINEALEIARRFSTFEATQFINGILDAIKRDLETIRLPR